MHRLHQSHPLESRRAGAVGPELGGYRFDHRASPAGCSPDHAIRAPNNPSRTRFPDLDHRTSREHQHDVQAQARTDRSGQPGVVRLRGSRRDQCVGACCQRGTNGPLEFADFVASAPQSTEIVPLDPEVPSAETDRCRGAAARVRPELASCPGAHVASQSHRRSRTRDR